MRPQCLRRRGAARPGRWQRYRLSLYAEPPPGALRYQAAFPTEAGAWQTHVLLFSDFTPKRRGRTPRNAPPLDPARLHAFSLLIVDRQAGPFRLALRWIKAVNP